MPQVSSPVQSLHNVSLETSPFTALANTYLQLATLELLVTSTLTSCQQPWLRTLGIKSRDPYLTALTTAMLVFLKTHKKFSYKPYRFINLSISQISCPTA
jgi:uncharacterized membrane protein